MRTIWKYTHVHQQTVIISDICCVRVGAETGYGVVANTEMRTQHCEVHVVKKILSPTNHSLVRLLEHAGGHKGPSNQ